MHLEAAKLSIERPVINTAHRGLSISDTDRDLFTDGAWFRGRLYEDKCDLSPDGELLVYFCVKGSSQGSTGVGTTTVFFVERKQGPGSPKALVSAVTETGRRGQNEDALLSEPEWGLYMVCDGMGDYAGGEVAAQMAVEIIRRLFKHNKRDDNVAWPFPLNPTLTLTENLVSMAVRSEASLSLSLLPVPGEYGTSRAFCPQGIRQK